MTRSMAFGTVVALIAIAILPAFQSSADVHEEPVSAVPGTWYTVSAVGPEDLDFLPVTTTVSQNGVEAMTVWDPKDMTISFETRERGANGTGEVWAWRVYGSTSVDAYINWVVYNKEVNATVSRDPGITFGFLVREAGMKNITVTIQGHRNGVTASESYQIRCDRMERAMINLSRIADNTVYFDAYPDSISSVYQNETVGLYGIGFKGDVRLRVVGEKGPIVNKELASNNYVIAYKWYVPNETKVGFYNVTLEGTDAFGNATTLRMPIEVLQPCPNPPNCLGIPPPRHGPGINWYIVAPLLIVISLVAVIGFTRLRRNSLLNQAMRARIYAAIEKSQGIHFHELMRVLDVKPGVLSHHINILEREKFIKSLQDGTYRRFFLYEANAELRVTLNNIQEKILALVRRSPGIFQRDISREIGSSGFVTNYHIKILRDAGMVMLERDGKNIRCFPMATP